jgi:uncharacterized protein YyaL (SSP411 family)
MMMAALSAYHAGISQIVIAGDAAASPTRELLDVARRHYLPFAITIPLDPAHADGIARLLPWAEAMARRTDAPAAYVCRDFACLAPATSVDQFAAQLEAKP